MKTSENRPKSGVGLDLRRLVVACFPRTGDFAPGALHMHSMLLMLLLASPARPVEMEVVVLNEYAESIFRVRAVLNEQWEADPTPVLVDERIESGRDKTGKLVVPVGTVVLLQVTTVSLGERYDFEIEVGAARAGRYCLAYDYDMALAKFRVRGDWCPSQRHD